MTKKPLDLALRMAEIMRDKRAEDLLVLTIDHLTVIADCMVIATGHSMTQVKALADTVEEKMSEEGAHAMRREGYAEGRWIVLDYGAVIVHIFHEQEREYYRLERLWMDGANSVALPEASILPPPQNGPMEW